MSDKVSQISKTDGTTIYFTYTAQQQRLSKKVVPPAGGQKVSTIYVYDGKGILMSTYTLTQNSDVAYEYKLTDHQLYGMGRVGVYDVNENLVTSPVQAVNDASKLFFEITDHLGSVRAIVNGVKDVNGNASIVQLNDYHEFGMVMNGRSFSSKNYRYGYQGSEKDAEISGMYTTEFRALDVRLGRWLSPDPITHPSWSPYASMNDNPIALTDVMGLEPGGGGPGTPTNNGGSYQDTRGNTYYLPVEDGCNSSSSIWNGSFSSGQSYDVSFLFSGINNANQVKNDFANLMGDLQALTESNWTIPFKAPDVRGEIRTDDIGYRSLIIVTSNGQTTYFQASGVFDNQAHMSPSTVEEVSDGNSALEYVQTGLDVLGLIPGVGAFADLTNALIYSWNGDYVAASISMAAIVVDGAILTKYAGKALGKTSEKVGKVVVEEAAKGGGQGGLNLFKWGAEQTGKSTGWKAGDYMLHLPNKGTPALNWKANYGALRSEMNLGKPIFDSYRLPNGNLIPTGGFLNAERYILQTRGWMYSPGSGAWMPPIR